jgi:hypothetical protein
MRFVGKRALKSIFGQVDGKIDEYRTNLVRLRDNLLARAAVTTEVAVLEAGTYLRSQGCRIVNLTRGTQN